MVKIQTIIYPEQEQAYYDAKDRGDVYAMHMFYIPPIYRSWDQIKSDMRFQELEETFKSEMKRIDEMDPELLRIETYLRFGLSVPVKMKSFPIKRKSFWERLFNSSLIFLRSYV